MTIIIMPPFFLITILSLTTTAAVSASDTANATTEFIRTSCETTLYKELCYRSLSGYANTVQQDPARLAIAAIGLSLSRAATMTHYVANLSRRADAGGSDPRAAAALKDCVSLFGGAVGQMRRSMKQMLRLTGGGEWLRFEMSNVQTWMSAALTDEDTCTDGFEGVDEVAVKVEVCDRTKKVKEVTSNALALVNTYVAKVIPS